MGGSGQIASAGLINIGQCGLAHHAACALLATRAALAEANLQLAQTVLGEIDKIIVLNRDRYAKGEISGSELRRSEVERMKRLASRNPSSSKGSRPASASRVGHRSVPEVTRSIVWFTGMPGPAITIGALTDSS